MDGPNLGLACFDNLIERTSVAGMDTAYRFLSAQGDETLNTLTNFWTADVMTGIWTSSVGNVGLSFRDGYMATGLQVAGRKAFKHTGGFPTIQTINIQTEFFDAPSDIPVSGGISSLGGLGLFVDGPVSGKRFTQLVSAADGYNCGSTSACPCRPGTYPPPPTLSFWASIPAGTALSAGSNEFTFYTFAFEEQTTPIADLYFTFHPTHTANIGQFFQLAGTNSVTTPYFSSFQTYTISLFVASAVTLTSDFVFLLEANTTSQSPIAGSCLYPPTL
jgi:hypothetical protein